MTKAIPSLLVALLCLARVGVQGEEFSGTFLFSAPEGNVTLILEQDEDGEISGTLNDGTSVFEFEGSADPLGISGDVYAEAGDELGFKARLEGDLLHLELFPNDPNGEPLYEMGQTVIFTRRGAAATGAVPAEATPREVHVNRVKLDDEFLRTMETRYRTPIEDGRYWYDATCGAWGVEGGATAGFILAGLNLPAPMPADISGGGTDIFINGREVHVLDKAALQQIFGTTIPGRYWLDAQGNLGPEGGAAIANLAAAIQAAMAAQGGGSGSVTHGYDQTYGARGTLAGGMYSGRTASGKSVLWYPGM